MPGLILMVIIAGSVDSWFGVIPKEFHKTNRKLIWGILGAGILNLVAAVMGAVQPSMAAMLFLLTLVLYFLFRAIGFLGLAYSFRAYSMEESAPISPNGILLAWLASTLDVVAVGAVVVESFVVGVQAGLSNPGGGGITPATVSQLNTHMYIALGIGFVFAVLFMLSMRTSKDKVFAFRKEELKRKNEERLRELKLKKQAAAEQRGPA